jgi:hypothetical protein
VKLQRICFCVSAVQLFGPYAAMKLCELSDGVLLDSLGQLDSCLSRWKELLDPVTLAVVVSGRATLFIANPHTHK